MNFILATLAAGLLVTFVIIVIFRLKKKQSIFKSLGIPGPAPGFLLGNSSDFMDPNNGGIINVLQNYIHTYGPVVGYFFGTEPEVIFADPEMARKIFVKDFHQFPNRKVDHLLRADPIFRLWVLNIENQHWKHVRSVISPTFSSGKLKRMIDSISTCADQCLEVFKMHAEDKTEFEAKKLFSCFSMDVIARTAFGIELDAQKTPNHPFVANISKLFPDNFPKWAMIFFIFPILYKLGVKIGVTPLFPRSSVNFFRRITKEIIEERQKMDGASEKYVDFLQLMIDSHIDDKTLQKEIKANSEHIHRNSNGDIWHDQYLTTDEISAQALLFFFAGHETTATTLSYFAHSMALNPDVQDKLIEEIDTAFRSNSKVTYENVHELKYLDQCINETLRLYPVLILTDRSTNADYEIAGFKLPQEVSVSFPIYYIHHNAEYWPDPEKFDPTRFENKSASDLENTYTYLPFGLGPRNCVGRRLALLEMKILLAQFYQVYKFMKSEKTEEKIEFFPNILLLKAKNGIHLKVEKR